MVTFHSYVSLPEGKSLVLYPSTSQASFWSQPAQASSFHHDATIGARGPHYGSEGSNITCENM